MERVKNNRILNALKDIYYTSFFVDLKHDAYTINHLAPWYDENLPDVGTYSAFVNTLVKRQVFQEYQLDVIHMLNVQYIKKHLDQKHKSYFYDYFARRDGQKCWCRMTVALIDANEHGEAEHVLVLFQDNTAQWQSLENSREAFNLLRDAYYRISMVDLNRNYIENLKIVESEWADETQINGVYDSLVAACADRMVHEDYKEKFLNLLSVDNLKAFFEMKKEPIAFTYQRLVGGEYKWVQTEVVPVDDYSAKNSRVFWYVKNISDEKARETSFKERMLEANAALRDAYAVANRANSAKTDFLSRMSHDIRTPMNAIIGMTAIAGTHLDDKSKVQDCLNKISASSRHLLSLINEILDMSKIESGKMVLSEEEIRLSDLIDNLLEMVRPQIKEKKHELRVHIHDLVHENVIGDSLRIQQIFINIMSNAVKYTPENGKIDLTIREKPVKMTKTGCYEFVFQDNGIGMCPQFLEKVFEPFERAEDERVNKTQGTGLGMAIVKNIVQMMDGQITVESTLGKGSKFTVRIYLKLQDDAFVTTAELAGLSVLVADDDQITCESTCMILEELGMKGEWVLSGQEAVDKIAEAHERQEDFFAAIVDWKMPGMDGIQTTKMIRKTVGPDVPVIIFSAFDWPSIEQEARAAGASAFISKPLFKSRLTHVLKSVVNDKQEQIQSNPLHGLQQSDYTGKCVLLVEDNELNRDIARELLELTGLTVEEAVDGKDAVDKFTASNPGYYDLIFMDIQMPVMNGYDAASAIRALQRTDARAVPILAMTANAFAEDVQAAKNVGMNEHIAKPLDVEKLHEVLTHWLS